MRDYMRKKHQMQHSSETFKACTKDHKQEEPVRGNENSDTAIPPKAKRM